MKDTIYFNGTILTMEEDKPFVTAILISDGRIKALGSHKELLAMKTSSTVCIDLKGKTMLPGLIDPHSHITAMSYQQLMVNVSPSPSGNCDSIHSIIKKCREHIKEHPVKEGQWLLATNYDQSAFANQEHPTKLDLDQISSSIPICLTHVSGHVAVFNSAALKIVGYEGSNYPLVEGGVIHTFPDSKEPSGLLEEQAFLSPRISSFIPTPSFEDVIAALKKVCTIYASYGITTTQDARSAKLEYQLLKSAGTKGNLFIDVVSYVSPEVADELLVHLNSPSDITYQNHYRVAGFKTFLDGSPQAKTAWLTKPYYVVPEGEDKNYSGFPVLKDEDILAQCKKCIQNKWQINAHCNGDAASEQFINAYTKALDETNEQSDLRPVMVHSQMVRDDQLDRMKNIHMLPTFFIDHVYYWGDFYYDSILGPIASMRISPLHSALERGISFTIHQDAPVVMPNMLFGLHNAVNRKTRKGRILGEDQRISVMEGLKCITINGAYQIFEEKEKGSLAIGKRADLCILSDNPLEVPIDKIKDIKVLETIKDGLSIFQLNSIDTDNI